MIEPEHPTEKYIIGRISFHESQARWFTDHDQNALATWARTVVEKWRKRLITMQASTPQTKGESQ